MKNSIKIIAITILGVSLLSSCTKDTEIRDPKPTESTVEVKFNNVVNGETIALVNKRYISPNKDTFSINGIKYLVSNIKLYNDNNLIYTEIDSYHFVGEKLDETKTISLQNVPVGTYDKIQIAIGVDAEHDNNSAGNGDLSTNNGLFWTGWNSYIYYRFDGVFHNDTTMALAFHAGGSTAYAVYDIDLANTPLVVSSGNTSNVYFDTEVNALFENPNVLDFQKLRNVAAQGTTMDSLGANIQTGLFELNKVVNP